jgi:hypothetical protein
MLSRSISQSEQVAAVSLEADYLFMRCIPHLDCEGRMSGNPVLVKSIACPLREEITTVRIPDLLRSLAVHGLVQWYEAEGKQVLAFPGFARHQTLNKSREATSKFPSPDMSTADLAAPVRRIA